MKRRASLLRLAGPVTAGLLLAGVLPAVAVLAQDGRPETPPRTDPGAGASPRPHGHPASSDPPTPVAGADDLATPAWEMTDESRKAIDRGLERLAARQEGSGRWLANGTYHMSATALAGLAFLAHGEVPGRGPYGDKLDKAVEFVLRSQWPESDPNGFGGLFFDYLDFNEAARPMHGHGFALLFLAEVYGQAASPTLRERIHKALVRGVKLTERTQSQAGGWYYLPGDGKDEGSVTITQIQGLRAARNAGIVVSKSTIDRAVEYIRRSQKQKGDLAGGVCYTSTYGDPSPALTAAGIAVYYGAGEYGSPGIELGFQYLAKNMRLDDRQHFWFYTHLYAVQAYHQRGGPEWASYFPRLRRELLSARYPNGEWDDSFAGPVFGTACAVLCLEVPLRYLPIFQR